MVGTLTCVRAGRRVFEGSLGRRDASKRLPADARACMIVMSRSCQVKSGHVEVLAGRGHVTLCVARSSSRSYLRVDGLIHLLALLIIEVVAGQGHGPGRPGMPWPSRRRGQVRSCRGPGRARSCHSPRPCPWPPVLALRCRVNVITCDLATTGNISDPNLIKLHQT